MKILAILAHPNRNSFSGAVLDRFTQGAEAAGHQVEVVDLYHEGFDPCFSSEDFEHYTGAKPISTAVAREQARLSAADALVLVFPIWWWSMPAILKGWVDRVFSHGYAFTYDDAGKTLGLLKHSKAVLLCPAASDHALYRRYGYHGAMQRQIDTGILGYCGIADVETFILPSVDTDADARKMHLEQAETIGREFDKASGLDQRAFD